MVLVWIIRWFLMWRVFLVTLSLAEQNGHFYKRQYCLNQLSKWKGKQRGCEPIKTKELKQNNTLLWMSGNLCRNLFLAEKPKECAKVMLQTKYDRNSLRKNWAFSLQVACLVMSVLKYACLIERSFSGLFSVSWHI